MTWDESLHPRDKGKFTEKLNDPQAGHLSLPATGGNVFSDPGHPVSTEIVYQAWTRGDRLQDINRVEFDSRALLDSLPLDRVVHAFEFSDNDWLADMAVQNGLLEQYDGPFEVELPEDIDEYIRHREDNGMTAAYDSAEELLRLARLDRNQERLGELREQMARIEADIARDGGEASPAPAAAPAEPASVTEWKNLLGDIRGMGGDEIRSLDDATLLRLDSYLLRAAARVQAARSERELSQPDAESAALEVVDRSMKHRTISEDAVDHMLNAWESFDGDVSAFVRVWTSYFVDGEEVPDWALAQ